MYFRCSFLREIFSKLDFIDICFLKKKRNLGCSMRRHYTTGGALRARVLRNLFGAACVCNDGFKVGDERFDFGNGPVP